MMRMSMLERMELEVEVGLEKGREHAESEQVSSLRLRYAWSSGLSYSGGQFTRNHPQETKS
eukprot:7332413-Pyramimonas_sp.AAC.1